MLLTALIWLYDTNAVTRLVHWQTRPGSSRCFRWGTCCPPGPPLLPSGSLASHTSSNQRCRSEWAPEGGTVVRQCSLCRAQVKLRATVIQDEHFSWCIYKLYDKVSACTHLQTSQRSVLHHTKEFLVAQTVISIYVKELKHCVQHILRQVVARGDPHGSLKLGCK